MGVKFARPDTAAAPFSVVQVADYSPSYSGNFIASLRAAAAQHAVRIFTDRSLLVLAEPQTWVSA